MPQNPLPAPRRPIAVSACRCEVDAPGPLTWRRSDRSVGEILWNLLAARRLLTAAALLFVVPPGLAGSEVATGDPARVVATVNGAKVTAGEWEFALFLRRLGADAAPAVRQQVLQQLVDRRLMQAFLADRKAKPDDRELDEQVARVHQLIKKSGSEPAEVLKKLQLSEARLKEEVALPLAWAVHSRRIITDARLRDYWMERRSEFDGTQLRASHILIKADPADAVAAAAAEKKLNGIKSEIETGKIGFSEAAKQSDAPSRNEGGDVGFFPYRGKMPAAFAEAAFRLKGDEISDPVRTPFGLHLIRVTERRPGDLSLEDVRTEVFQRLQQQLWNEILADQRGKAKIQVEPAE